MLSALALAVSHAPAPSSKLPFYVLGGVLVVWAVVVGAIGVRNPGFPSSERGARGVMSLTLLMVVLAIGAAVVTA